MAITYEYRGKVFPSLNALRNHFPYPKAQYTSFRNALHKGIDIDEAIKSKMAGQKFYIRKKKGKPSTSPYIEVRYPREEALVFVRAYRAEIVKLNNVDEEERDRERIKNLKKELEVFLLHNNYI